MTDQQHQQPYAGGPGGQAPQGQIPYGAQQGSYGQAQPPQNPYGQQPQNPYGQPGQPQNPYGLPTAPNYGPPPKKVRRNYGMIARIVGGVAVLGLVGGGYLINEHNKAGRSSDGSIDKKGDLGAFSLKTGDCFENPKDASVGFSSVKAVPCAEPHDSQVYFSFTYPNPPASLPLDSEMQAIVSPKCKDARDKVLDQDKVPEDAEAGIITSDSRAWSAGRHEIQCIVHNPTDFTGSLVKA